MIELIYASAAVQPMSDRDLHALLERSRVRNVKTGLTGLLLHDRGSFLQVLEGEPLAVGTLFATIAKDPRHNRVTTLLEGPIRERAFDRWSMGFVSLEGPVRQSPGFSEFLAPAFSVQSFLSKREHTAARQILLAFRDGRFRSFVDV
jgi:hypothetical protein